MTVKAAETAAPFSEATCQALSAVVLRMGGLSYQSAVGQNAVPGDLVEALRELATTDPALAKWASSVTHHLAEPAVDKGSRSRQTVELLGDDQSLPTSATTELPSAGRSSEDQSSDDGWPLIAAKLPELLIVHGPKFAADVHHSAGSQLQSVCHVVLRLRTLENCFADELQRQKREAIYQFAYGLSHELNNPLANIATRGGVLAEQETQPQRKTLLEAIVTNAMRGCEMLGDLMLVARPPQLTFNTVGIDSVVTSVVDSARRWTKNLDVDLRLNIQSSREIQLDATALREALWALIRNGLEAMCDGGTITVSVTDCEPPNGRSLGCEPGGVCIEISDQGSGLSRVALEHCFDPYYSGREAGRGLGLGLSKAQRIVELHHGRITLANRPGGGVIARVVLPPG